MNKYLPKHFYLFKGNWLERFDELQKVAKKNKHQYFEIWEPLSKARNHCLLIVCGRSLSNIYCLAKTVWKTDESVFLNFFQPNISLFHIHRFNEINSEKFEAWTKDKALLEQKDL